MRQRKARSPIAIGGGSCLCYLPTVLARQLGEYEKAGLAVELVDLKGGSDALKAVLGGSADVVSGYFDHCVNLAAKKQELQSFVVYDRYPGLVLVVSPSHNDEIKSIKDLAGKKVGVSAPGSSTDFFLKYLLKKNGLDPTSASVIGVGLGATAVAAMQQGQIDAAVMLDPSVTVLQGSYPDLQILSDTRTQKDTLDVFGGEYPGGSLYTTAAWIKSHEKEVQALTKAIVNTLDLDSLAFAGRDHGEDAAGNRRQEQGALSRGAEEHDPDVFDEPARWTPRARTRCSRCSARVRPRLPRPISTSPRPTPTSLSNRPRRRRDERQISVIDRRERCRSEAMNGTTPPVIHRVTTLDLRRRSLVVAVRRRAARRDRWRISPSKQREKPQIWNGRVLLGRNPVFTGDRFSASYFETDFASFLAWRDWGFPDRDVFNGFGMGALRCADGAFVLGEMGQHTVQCRAHLFSVRNARSRRCQGRRGRHSRQRGARSSRKKPGCAAATTASDPHWDCVFTGPAVAMIRHVARRYVGRSAARAGSRPISPAAISPNFPPSIWCAERAISPRRCRALSPPFIEAQFAANEDMGRALHVTTHGAFSFCWRPLS